MRRRLSLIAALLSKFGDGVLARANRGRAHAQRVVERTLYGLVTHTHTFTTLPNFPSNARGGLPVSPRREEPPRADVAETTTEDLAWPRRPGSSTRIRPGHSLVGSCSLAPIMIELG